MKTFTILTLSLLAVALVGCSDKPMTDADMAAEYGLSIDEFQEQKEAAARMNMSIEDHLGGGHGNSDHSSMEH